MEPLIAVTDLAGFRGAPFAEPVTIASAESVRTDCGWHIAPVATETVRLRAAGAAEVLLPTLKLVEVLSVEDADGRAVDGWQWWEEGVLERPGGFPHFIEVTFRHGFAECPRDLLPVIAERAAAGAGGRIKQESLAGRSVSLDSGYDPVSSTTVAAYKLHGRP